MTPPESQASPTDSQAMGHLSDLERLLPTKTELEPYEVELGFQVMEVTEGEFGPTVILGREISADSPALSFRPQDHPDLAFVGGAARAGLAVALGLEPTAPRDIDVIRVSPGESLPAGWEETRDTWTDLEGYMARRDLTINEVLLWHETGADGGRLQVYATREAICDTLNGVIAPSLFEHEDGEVRSRLAARAIRFAAKEQFAGRPVALQLPPIIGDELWTFDLALQFERSVEAGCEAEYMSLCRPYADIPDSVHSPRDMLAWLQERLIEEAKHDSRDPFEFSQGTYDRLDPDGFIAKLRALNELDSYDDPLDEEAYGRVQTLGAKQFRHFSRLARDPKLSEEDLVGS
jgi:hypothetical protein